MVKPVVFIPAYNEEKYLPNLLIQLASLQQQGAIGEILLINDGSKDRTEEIARHMKADLGIGMEIMSFAKNHGKARAFYEAVKFFEPMHPSEMLMLDADLKRFDSEQLYDMEHGLGKVTQKEIPNRKMPEKRIEYSAGMVIGRRYTAIQFGGERLFDFASLLPILKRKEIAKMLLGSPRARGGYGLENFLNNFFFKRHWADRKGAIQRGTVTMEPFETSLHSTHPQRHGREKGIADKMNVEMSAMNRRFDRRLKMADEYRQKLHVLKGTKRKRFITKALEGKKRRMQRIAKYRPSRIGKKLV